jgi:hypothetical protein
MLDLNHRSGPLCVPAQGGTEPTTTLIEQINAHIDLGIAKEAAREPPRNYLGASQLGDPCLRKLVYHYRGAPEKQPEGRMRRIWQRGHWAEARLIAWLRQAGFTVIDRARDGAPIKFSQAGGKIAGHVDGVVTSGPARLLYPLLLELKCLKNSSWNELRKHGLAQAKEIYNAQIHLYMAYLNLKHCLFGAENADTMELYWEMILLDLAEAQRVSDRGVEVIRFPAGELPPRIAARPDFFLCRWCQFAEHCWRGE